MLISTNNTPTTSELAIVVVTFHPNPERLEKLIRATPTDSWVIVVDNTSTNQTAVELAVLLSGRDKTHLIQNSTNVGLAAAINQGADFAAEHIASATYLLLMDQDSVPFAGAIECLLTAHAELERSGHRVGCVGPRLIDKYTGLQHGFHRIEGWRWVRVYPNADDRTPISCSNLNGSGTLLKTSLFQTLKGLDESFFIDHVDTEWAFRVLASGYLLFGIPKACFDHAMGEKSFRFWCFGWRIWPQRSPFRHYFLFRNALWLMRRSYVPRVWKSWAAIKLGLTLLLHGIGDPLRRQQVSKMGAGIWHGIRQVPESIPSQRLV